MNQVADTDKIAGPVGRRNKSFEDRIASLSVPYSRYEIHAKNATQLKPDIVKLATIAPLFQVYSARPASCNAKTKRVEAIRRSKVPRKSTLLNLAREKC